MKDEYTVSSSTSSGISTCTPYCPTGAVCGSDGCGGSCGTCSGSTPNCINYQCSVNTCTPSCVGKQCGSDGCSGSCGTCLLPNSVSSCSASYQCIISSCNTGYANCDSNTTNGCETLLGTISNCASCGNQCSTGQTCTNNVCVTPSTPPTATIINVYASASQDSEHLPVKTLDRIFSDTSRWAAEGDGQWITYELNQTASVSYVRLAFYYSTQRYFDIQYSTNNATWINTSAYGLTSAANMANQYQTFSFTPVNARYIRIVGHGSSAPSLWNSIVETDVNGFALDLPASVCTTHTSSNCTNGDVYWWNSCGQIEGIRYDCNSTQTCSAGACVNNQISNLPLKISSNSRYLTYQNNEPFLMTGDTAWSLIVQVNKSDADYYLQSRSDKGFNTVLVNLIEHQLSDNAPSNIYNTAHFTGKTFTTPNEAYFAHADYVINSAKEKGIVVLLAPIYLGWRCNEDGWCSEVQLASESDMLAWGRYVGERYQDYDNIIWVIGGDTDPRDPVDVKSKTQRVAEGIKEYMPNALFTAHNIRGQMAVDPWSGASWLNVNDVYTTDAALGQNSKKAYEEVSPIKPFFLLEAYYENDNHGLSNQQL